MTNTTIYRITNSNTRPIGFGYAPKYSVEQPTFSDRQLSDDRLLEAEPVEVILPDGYEIAANNYDEMMLWDASGNCAEIVDDHGHPAIIIGAWQNKQGKPYPRYQRLDK